MSGGKIKSKENTLLVLRCILLFTTLLYHATCPNGQFVEDAQSSKRTAEQSRQFLRV